jgi:hypothetical protein
VSEKRLLIYLGGLILWGHLTPRDLWTTYQQSAQAEARANAPVEP